MGYHAQPTRKGLITMSEPVTEKKQVERGWTIGTIALSALIMVFAIPAAMSSELIVLIAASIFCVIMVGIGVLHDFFSYLSGIESELIQINNRANGYIKK